MRKNVEYGDVRFFFVLCSCLLLIFDRISSVEALKDLGSSSIFNSEFSMNMDDFSRKTQAIGVLKRLVDNELLSSTSSFEHFTKEIFFNLTTHAMVCLFVFWNLSHHPLKRLFIINYWWRIRKRERLKH